MEKKINRIEVVFEDGTREEYNSGIFATETITREEEGTISVSQNVGIMNISLRGMQSCIVALIKAERKIETGKQE